ncbi:MAG: SIR2 family protein [Egibacteraceae bacterium]
MGKHDPQRVVELLQDHLAAHDKRLLFLFGAGTSSAANTAPAAAPGDKPVHTPLIPALGPMTATCKEGVAALSAEHAAAWGALEAECTALDLEPHIENMLGRIRRKIDATGAGELVFGLTIEQLEAFEGAIRTAIVKMTSPTELDIPSSLPHDDFAVWVRHARRRHPVEIFTTNYDVLVERSLELARVPVFDGFVGSYAPYFSPDALESDAWLPGNQWVRLWKVHGSVNWESRAGSVVRLTGPCSGEMILPSHRKYDESRKQPYLALLDRLARSMSQEGALLISCGYSWNDEHINAAIVAALDSHPANHAIALVHPKLSEVPNLCDLAADRMNLIVAGPREGIVRRVRAEWALPRPIDGPTASFVDIAFDSDARQEDGFIPITGVMRVGDFNWFCRFLLAMDSPTVGV